MDVLPDEQETLIQETAREFFAAESTPALVRATETNPSRYSAQLWQRIAELGWLGISLPEAYGGQGLPLAYAGLLLEEAGRYIAPVPLHGTLVVAQVLARHGSDAQRALLRRVIDGDLILSYAVQDPLGAWSYDSPGLTGRRDGGYVVLNGSCSFVDGFRASGMCLVLYRMEEGGVAAALVDTGAPGVSAVDYVTTAKDSQARVNFSDLRVPLCDVVDESVRAEALARDLFDIATALMCSQLVGATRRDMEFAVAYAAQREAFGQPIGAFQSIQHLCADMLIAVDGAQLLTREALWRMDQGIPASVEVSQAKAFASDKCVFVARSAQQIHGGIGFMMECDLQLWYRRIVAWSLRCGTVREHRQRVAAALLDQPGKVRLGMPLEIG